MVQPVGVQLSDAVPESAEVQLSGAVPESSEVQLSDSVPESAEVQLSDAVPESAEVQLSGAVPESSEVQLSDSVPESAEVQLSDAVPESAEVLLIDAAPESAEVQLNDAAPESAEAQAADRRLSHQEASAQSAQQMHSQRLGSEHAAHGQPGAAFQMEAQDVGLHIDAAVMHAVHAGGSVGVSSDHAAGLPVHQQHEEQLDKGPQQQQQDTSRQPAAQADSTAAQQTDYAVHAEDSVHADQMSAQPADCLQRAISADDVLTVSDSTGSQPEVEPLQKGISGLWRDCNSPISSTASAHLSNPDADAIDPAEFDGLDMSHSMRSSSSRLLSSSSSANDDAAIGWGSETQSQPHAADVLVLETQAKTCEHELDNSHGSSELANQGDEFIVQSALRLPQGAEPVSISPSACDMTHVASSQALTQGSTQNALMQQGMAAATAQLLLMGSQWGSNLGSLCNLGLIVSPAGFILLSSKYEIIEIIGEGAYGQHLTRSPLPI